MATFTVTETNDNVAGSLREAINGANDAPGPDEIQLAARLSGRTIEVARPLAIAGDLDINGLGADRLVIDGNGSDIFRINVDRIAVVLTGITIEGGGDGIEIDGGRNSVTVTDSRVRQNGADDGLKIDGDGNRVIVDNSVFEGNEDNISYWRNSRPHDRAVHRGCRK